MIYVIAKVNDKENYQPFDSMFGIQSRSKIEFISNEFYSTPEEAEKSLEKFKIEQDKKCNEDFNKFSDSKQADILEKLEKPNTVYTLSTYIIVPIHSVHSITSNPSKSTEADKDSKDN